MIISTGIFKGIRPKTASHLLENNEAQTAQNCKLYSGSLMPWYNKQEIVELELTVSILTIYYYLSSDWFEFSAEVDIVEGPVASDTANKRYYTGDGIPKKTNETEATTGSGAMPINFYPMQVPVPETALTATPSGSGGTGDDRDVTYVWTVVTSWGEEGPPSDASTIVQAKNGETVNLSGMDLTWQAGTAYTLDHWVIPTSLGDYVYKCTTAGTSGGAEPSPWGTTVDGNTSDGTCVWRCYKKGILYDSGGGKRIYRSAVGYDSANYRYLTQIAMATTAYADSTTDTNLGEIATVLDYISPPDTLIGLVGLSNGISAGFVGKDIYFSEPYYPHAFTENTLSLTESIVGLGVVGSTTVALTDGHPYVIPGSSPESMTPNKLPDIAPCMSKKGIVSCRFGVIFPTANGLYMIDGVQGQLLTKDIVTKNEWDDYYPSTMHGHFHDNKYIGFYKSGSNEGGIVYDLTNNVFTTLDFYATAAYTDPTTDIFYYNLET